MKELNMNLENENNLIIKKIDNELKIEQINIIKKKYTRQIENIYNPKEENVNYFNNLQNEINKLKKENEIIKINNRKYELEINKLKQEIELKRNKEIEKDKKIFEITNDLEKK